MVAKNIMTRKVITIDPATAIKELAKVLSRSRISGVPVVDKKGKILGIVSEADIIGKKGRQVKSIMSSEVISVTEETPVAEIAVLMTAHRIKRVPVVRDGKLVGIISRGDIVSAVARGEHIALHSPIYDL
jgi:CBS domain-containing protein